MATDFFRRSIELPAWSGGKANVERLLTIIFAAFESEKSSALEGANGKAAKDIDGMRTMLRNDDVLASRIASIEAGLEQDARKIEETFDLRANIDTGKVVRTTTGTPEEIVERLDEGVRQDLSVRCPGLGGSRYTDKEISVSMTSKYGVSIEIQGSDRLWVSGMYDRLIEEVSKQTPSDAWLIKWWARGITMLATFSLVTTLGLSLPVPLEWKVALILSTGWAASMFAYTRIDTINRFELIAPGGKARASKSWAVFTYLISAVVLPILIYIVTR